MTLDVHFSTGKDDWNTPRGLYEKLDADFHFTLDACTAPDNPLRVPKFFTEQDDGLAQDWTGEVVWMNPPYSKLKNWLEKAATSGARTVLALIPARTDTKAFQQYVLGQATEVLFIKGRLKFGDSKNSAPFPSALVLFGEGSLPYPDLGVVLKPSE